MRPLRSLTLFFVAIGLAVAGSSHDRLAKVKTVFVAPLEGQTQGMADMLHEKLIGSLAKLPEITLVDDEENADAILSSALQIQALSTEYGHTVYVVQGGVRLTAKEGGVVLWADNVRSSHFARSATTSYANNVAKALEKAFTGDTAK